MFDQYLAISQKRCKIGPTESLCPSDGGPRPRLCAGGRRRGVINNFDDSRTLMITVTVDINKVGRMKVC